jgi:short-subunit dehydrogenase
MTKKVFIMGASTGIGKALAIKYAKADTILGLASRRIELLEEIKIICESLSCKTFIYKVDVRQEEDCLKATKHFIKSAKGIDIIIANSGIGISDDILSGSSQKINSVLKTNIIGVTNTIIPFLPKMKEQRKGIIVVVSSVASYLPIPDKGGYSASKVAVRRLFDSWRPTLRGYGINTVSICPGFIDTPMTEKIIYKPFLKNANEAASAFINAINKSKSTYIYPWQMRWIIKIINILPNSIYNWIIYKYRNVITNYDKN